MDVRETIVDFIGYLKVEKKYASHTCISYDNDLQQFADFLKHQYGLEEIDLIKHTHVRTWIVHMMGEGITPVSVNRKISALRTFFHWLIKRKKLSINPMSKVLAPKKPRRLPVFVQEQQAERMLEEEIMDDSRKFEQIRDLFIVETLYATGIRRAELRSMQISDVDLYKREIRVTGKGNKVRIVPVTEECIVHLKNYLLLRNEVLTERGIQHTTIFISHTGRPVYDKLIYQVVRDRLSSLTTMQKRSPHTLRHSFATHMLNAGADLNAIKELLGHASLAATQVYTHNSIAKLKDVYGKTHPRSKLL
jgi:integrase/recombinase XerC